MDMTQTINCLNSAGLRQPLLLLCTEIVEVLSALNEDTGSFMPLSFFHNEMQENGTIPELFEALNLLSSFECAVLDAHGYLESISGEPLVLEDSDFSNLMKTGELAHPETGDLIHDPMSEVRLYYSLRSREDINAQL